MGKVDIAAAILEFALKGLSLQDLQARMSVSRGTLEENLTLLKSKDLISFQKGSKKEPTTIVRTTKRGIQFLNMYNSMSVKYLTISK